MKEIKDDDLFLPGGYASPEDKNVVIDTTTGQVEEIKNLPPLQQIKMASAKFNITLNDKPKKNCKKCYERGYIGFDSKEKTPIACTCMFPKGTDAEAKKNKDMIPLNLLSKKVQRKFFRDKKKALIKEIKKESTLRELRKIKDSVIDKLAQNVLSGSDEIKKESEDLNGTVSQG